MVIDPVCGMDVNEKTAAGKSEYRGETYYFSPLAARERLTGTRSST